MKKVVIACDKYKGCLSAREVVSSCEVAMRRVSPRCVVVSVPVGDGGEGTSEALTSALGGGQVCCGTVDALGRKISARYCLSDSGDTAVIDMAAAAGLALLDLPDRNPELTSTRGVGLLIVDAVARGARRIILGLGGSATNDCGLGMLEAMGYVFRDAAGNRLTPVGASLAHVASIDDSGVSPVYREVVFEGACDVTNPLYGPTGAAAVFAPQKGADHDGVERLDRGMRNFADVVREKYGVDMQTIAGAGAAGGLGGALAAFLGARLRRGIDLVLDLTHFDDALKDADLVITGEGHIDAQTLMGKAPMGVLERARRCGVPVIAIAGRVDDRANLLTAGFDEIIDINASASDDADPLDSEVAKRRIVDALVRRFLH